ncbi:hypothetical protein L7F22_025329 [Adiantum nelumboides]|nr:hypothetical protein [Adiantum nelumboides]
MYGMEASVQNALPGAPFVLRQHLARPRRTIINACSSRAEEDRFAGRLSFSPAAEPCWDSVCSFHPIVLKEPSSGEWRMYFYGRNSSSWNSGVTPALLTSGRIGMACSRDGLLWTRTVGPLSDGAIMDPRDGATSGFDTVHVGCSDVLFHDGIWWMYYFGGGLEETALSTSRKVTGMRLRTGLAKSCGNGIDGFDNHRAMEPILDVGEPGDWDEMMVAWARVLPPSPMYLFSHWLMTYASMSMHATSAPGFCIGAAISQDGHSWMKVGKVLEQGESGSWDEAGVSRRHVIFWDGQFLMFYEGANKKGVHAIGLALSKDGLLWVKDKQGFDGEPGGPVFFARVDCVEAWDSGSVACPHVVRRGDSLWLYYVGYDTTKKNSAFGVACSDGKNFRNFSRIGLICFKDE